MRQKEMAGPWKTICNRKLYFLKTKNIHKILITGDLNI